MQSLNLISNQYSNWYDITSLAGEALGVPLSIEGSDEALHDGLGAAMAARSILLIIALTTEGLLVLLMESLTTKVLATEGAEKVLRMPCLIQSTHHSLCVCVCVWGGGEDERRRKKVLWVWEGIVCECERVVWGSCVSVGELCECRGVVWVWGGVVWVWGGVV